VPLPTEVLYRIGKKKERSKIPPAEEKGRSLERLPSAVKGEKDNTTPSFPS